MNITQSTTPAASGQDVALRTLASDIASLERGDQAPTPERVTTHPSEAIQEDAVKIQKEGVSVVRLLLAIVFLISVGVAIYIYVYPHIIEAVQSSSL